MTDLSSASITWRGLTLYGGDTGRFTFATLEGWEDLPAVAREAADRPLGHGTMGGAPLARTRVVRASGLCSTPAERDAMLLELQAVMALADPEAPTEDLTIDHAGRVLTAHVYLSRFAPSTDLWGTGMFRWVAEWVADDPLRYGPAVAAEADFPQQVGGLHFPLYSDGAGANVGALDFGAAPTSGRVTLTNSGVARASMQFEVTGPTPPEGFEIRGVGTAGRLVYAVEVPAGAVVLMDGATGLVLQDGVTDRGDALTYRAWPTVAPGASVELAFLSLGSRTAAHLRASLQPPVW